MIEQKLNNRLRRAAILTACISVAFLVLGWLLSGSLQDTRRQILKDQVIAEAEEYRSRVRKQLQSDFQTLATLAVFIGQRDSSDWALLANRLSQTQEYNNFINIVYFDRDGRGIICARGGDIMIDAVLSDLSAQGRQCMEKALAGESSLSELFESKISQQSVFAYGIPVYDGDEVIGALGASDHIEIFSEILSGNTVLGGGGYIHMIDSQGNFLIRSSKTVVKEDNILSIFDRPYLSQSSQEKVQKALQNQQQIFSTFTYEGQDYPFLLKPIGVNSWYLFCVNTGEGINANINSSIRILQVMFALVVVIIVFLMIYGYRLLRNYNHDLLQLAYHDTLTGAENLPRFRQRLVQALTQEEGCIVAFSIRQFPFLTEIFGKETSNRLLCQIREIVGQHIQNGEFFCRDTEDRFYLFLSQTDPDAIRSRLERMIRLIEQFPLSSHTDYRLAVYCGVTLSDKNVDAQSEAENMLTRIHFALEKARGGHNSTIWFFDTELHKQEELENYIESHMYHALQNKEFKLFLQPKIRLADGALAGAEALVRWQTSDGRTVFPNQFIPLFERNGFCVSLDLYMVEQACRQIRSWTDRGLTPVPVSVNQSKLLFFETNYVQMLTQLLETYQVPAHLIILEILEGLALENADELNAKIAQLQEIGFRISLDDFGSGYSSLNTLGKLQINEVKLDRDFLVNASDHKHERVRLIMEETVHMASRLGISTVAEGIETPEDEQFVRSIGCDVGQGYLYSRPLSADDFDRTYMEFAHSAT